MNHPTLLVWEGRWPLTDDLDVQVRVFEDHRGAYRLTLEYPPLPVAGEPCDGFDVTAGTDLGWDEVLDYLARCRMTDGWEPASPPPRPPAPTPVDAHAAGAARRTLFRPAPRILASPRPRRVGPWVVGGRRRVSGITWTVPEADTHDAA